MVERHLNGGESDFDALGAGCDGGGECDGVNVGAGAVVVMFSEPDGIESELLGEFSLAERVGDGGEVVVRRRGLRKEEISEFHCFLSAAYSRMASMNWEPNSCSLAWPTPLMFRKARSSWG